ncbi:MAG: DmsE family decaheme c-type cytochrome [Bryobacteraceae bacterium]|nr:DmsE family decaheme c-type cytochrome [Bryobacteraceae bacterium]MDW8378563.1 DmsE family decaheme c-type cytochrome [Bryobacterales bacterium]
MGFRILAFLMSGLCPLLGQSPQPSLPKSLAEAVAAASPTGFVGSSVCRICHPDVWQSFFRNPHYKSLASGKSEPENTGCESCHGPAKGHVEAQGGKTTIPVAFSLLSPAKTLDTCLRCHGKDLSRIDIRRSSHSQAEVACAHCHSIHKSTTQKFLLARDQRDLCYGCHGNVRVQFAMPFKHRVNEGFMNCTDCHNPHGAPAATWRMGVRPRMVAQALANEEPCLKCHTDKRGPFAFEHPAVRVDGCESCHHPHGSTNAKLLRRPAVFTTCLECHTGGGTFGRQADGIAQQSPTHDMRNPRYQNCTACHVRIHGSNADRLFLR